MGKFSLFLFHFDLHTNHYKQKQAIYIHNLWNSSTASSWPWLLPALLLVDDLNFVSHVFHAPTTLPCLILKYLIFIKAFGVPICNWYMLLRRIYPRQNWNFWFAHQVAAHLQHQVQKIKYRRVFFSKALFQNLLHSLLHWSCVQGGKQSLDSYSLEIGSLLLRINESTSEMSIFSLTEKHCLCILLIKRVIERTLFCNLGVFIKSTYCKYC